MVQTEKKVSGYFDCKENCKVTVVEVNLCDDIIPILNVEKSEERKIK